MQVLEPVVPGLLRPVLPVAGFHRVRGTIDLLVDDDSVQPALRDLGRVREADTAVFAGPLGHGFEIHQRSRHLLLVADGSGLARVRAMVDEALAGGRNVTVLLGAASVARVYPATMLPDEVEYVVATDDGSLGHQGPVTDLVPEYEAWADQCFAAGSAALEETMALLARGRDGRLGVARLGPRRRRPRRSLETRRRAWLQISLGLEASCALAVCLGCVATGAKGPLRICREGPTFASEQLLWDAAR